jgi:acetyl-CoA acyltransferase
MKNWYETYFKDPKREPVLIDYVRTPIGKRRGRIIRLRGDDLVVHAYQTLLERNKFDRDLIGDSMVSCCTQIGECGMDIGRNAALAVGLPVKIPGMSINRHCASGSQAVLSAWQAIASGYHDCVLVGGMEVQNRYPIMEDLKIFKEGKVIMVSPHKGIVNNPEVKASAEKYKQGIQTQISAADLMGRIWQEKAGLTKEQMREQLDRISLDSHKKACATYEQRGKEIEPIWVPKLDENGELIYDENGNVAQDSSTSELVEKDEGPRPNTSFEKLQKLPVLGSKRKGLLTAGNSCPTSDAAGAQLWMTRSLAEELGFKPRAKIVSSAVIGCDPITMLEGPIHSMPIALKRAETTLDEMDFIEINEAFSTVVFACCHELGLDWQDERFNVWGGAIAIGHPTGFTGSRLIGTNLQQLEQSNKTYAISSMCVGLGMGQATIIKRE